MKEIEVKIPQYLTLKHYRDLDKVYSLEKTEQILETISRILDIPINEVKTWGIGNITSVWNEVAKLLEESTPEFYPILEHNGVLYGYVPLSKMSVAEYIDLDNLIKDKITNIEQIMSILYRPIKKHRIKSLEFKIKSQLKLIFTKEKVEHLFDYYDVEDYSSDKRKQQAKTFNDFPASVGLGAMAFFLGVAKMSLIDSQTSTLPSWKISMLNRKMMSLYKNIMGGYTRYMSYQSLPSYKSGIKTTFSI